MMKVFNIAIFHVNVSKDKLFIMDKKIYRDSHLEKPELSATTFIIFFERVFPDSLRVDGFKDSQVSLLRDEMYDSVTRTDGLFTILNELLSAKLVVSGEEKKKS